MQQVVGQALEVDVPAVGAETNTWPRALILWTGRIAVQQDGRLFLWSPAALIAGIWIYFALPWEPGLAVALTISALALTIGIPMRTSALAVLIAIAATGFVLAKVRSDAVATPLLAATMPNTAVSGRVISVERSSKNRLTVVLAPDAVEGLVPLKLPKRLRLSLTSKYGHPMIGTRVALTAHLTPLPTPAAPGGFDYGRKLWFESVGGTGRILSSIQVIDDKIPARARFESAISEIRSAMGARIHAVLQEPYASVAEALITGERSTIPKDMNQSLMASGLFHILSISGLHMWLVAGGVFWSVRATLALTPLLALRFPIKKWAAVAALGMGLFYMLLADSGVATQRSYVMIAAAFFAILVDRPALTLRTLAIAALLVLVFEPEAAVEASFQMSFLAVLGLVAFTETWSDYRRGIDRDHTIPPHWSKRLAIWGLKGTAMALMTTVIAGSLSSIPAVYHFGRLSPYSVIANGLAIPVVGFVVMPSALLAAILMPLGPEALPLQAMELGLRGVMTISDWVASFSGANVIAPPPSIASAMVMASGAIWLCLIAGWARLAGLGVMLAGLAMAAVPEDGPDILVERTGRNVAIRTASGLFVPALPKRARFTVEKWLRADGDETSPGDAARRPGWSCAENRCDAAVEGRKVSYFRSLEGTALDCTGLNVVIADFPLRGKCKAAGLRIDRFDLWRSGAHAVRLNADGFQVETARDAQGARPWVVTPERRATPYKPGLTPAIRVN